MIGLELRSPEISYFTVLQPLDTSYVDLLISTLSDNIYCFITITACIISRSQPRLAAPLVGSCTNPPVFMCFCSVDASPERSGGAVPSNGEFYQLSPHRRLSVHRLRGFWSRLALCGLGALRSSGCHTHRDVQQRSSPVSVCGHVFQQHAIRLHFNYTFLHIIFILLTALLHFLLSLLSLWH